MSSGIGRVAVIGGGIAGLSAAWHLSKYADVTVYEAEAQVGGHARTIDAPEPDGGYIPIDVGFIVYNSLNYPNLTELFSYVDVETTATSMSLAVSLDGGAYEYSGRGIGGLFGQRRNILRPDHWRVVRDLRRFFAEAPVARSLPNDVTLGDWLSSQNYSDAFVARHIIPMGAAIWSTPADQMLGFPVAAFMRFFENHGLLKVRNRPQWRTVVGGSRNYVERLVEATDAAWRVSTPVREVRPHSAGVTVVSPDGSSDDFDRAVIATHGDVALSLLGEADALSRDILGAFKTTANEAVLHRDARLMPKRRRLWSSWNYVTSQGAAPASSASVTQGDRADLCVSYWMNSLQPLKTSNDWFVTLNPSDAVSEETVAARLAWRHPLFDRGAIEAQSRLWSLQGRGNIWFCGSYFGYGFHEDACQAGLAVAEDISGVARPWTRDGQNDRLHLPRDWPHHASARGATAGVREDAHA
ncbi:MAG: FAD-dependent oxidoreductase [Pseudomonadota bacterium]